MTTVNQHYVTVYYTLRDDPFDDYLKIETDGRYMDRHWLDSVAADCAKDYYHEHDGWELSWNGPIRFTLWQNAETKLGSFEVHMEPVPTFHAYEDDDD